MSDKQIDHAQRIAHRIQARNLALVPPTRTNAASPSMCCHPTSKIGTIPSSGLIVRGDTEYIHWIDMDVSHTDDFRTVRVRAAQRRAAA